MIIISLNITFFFILYSFSVARQTHRDTGPLSVEVSRSHTHTRRHTDSHTDTDTHTHTDTDTRYNPSEPVISSSHRPLPAQHTTHKHPCPQRDSNPRTERSSCRRSTRWTAWPPGWTLIYLQAVDRMATGLDVDIFTGRRPHSHRAGR